MSSTLVVEDGSGLLTSNSYCTSDEALEYFEDHLYATDFTGATDTDQEAALIWATRLLNDKVVWIGLKKTEDQALEWPRVGVFDRNGYWIDDDIVPTFVKYATAELARHLIISDITADSSVRGFKSIQVDTIKLVMDKYNPPTVIPRSVWDILRHYASAPAQNAVAVRI